METDRIARLILSAAARRFNYAEYDYGLLCRQKEALEFYIILNERKIDFYRVTSLSAAILSTRFKIDRYKSLKQFAEALGLTINDGVDIQGLMDRFKKYKEQAGNT